MIASLAMYNRPEMQVANENFWALIQKALAARGIDAPDHLTVGAGAYWAAWQSPDLVLSQTCGLPYRTELHRTVQLVGTPDYGVEGCPAGFYRSCVLVRADDHRNPQNLDGATLAINDPKSQSGWAAAASWMDQKGIRPGKIIETSAHGLSAHAVAQGDADFAALDAVTWSILQDYEPVASKLRVLDLTDPTPGLPYITSATSDADAIFDAVAHSVTALSPEDRQTLRLRGFVRIPKETYLAVSVPPSPAQFVHDG